MLGGSLCIFSCLLLAWTKWNKQNKEPIREHCEIGLEKFGFIGEEVKGSICHQGRDLFILLVVLRLHLRAPMPLESTEGSCVHEWEHWHFEQSQRDDFWKCSGPSFAKGQTAWEGMIFVFKELMSWLGRKGMICTKSLKILTACSHAWPKPSGPRRMSDSDNPGV